MMTPEEILNDINASVLYTLHAHTQYCDGRATMAEFVERAETMGFTHYGFTPHSPIPFESSCNMAESDVAKYLAEVDTLQGLHPKVHLYKGMEIDYLGDHWNAQTPYFQQLGLDYMISSVHFIPNQEGEYYDIDGKPEGFMRQLSENFHGDLRYVVDTFFEHSQRMVATGGYQIVGHFDKIKLNGGYCMADLEQQSWYKQHVDDLIDAIIASGTIVEINTKSWKEFGHMFPAQRHWRRLIEAEVPIVVNSDVHYLDRLNLGRPEALKALRYLRQHIGK